MSFFLIVAGAILLLVGALVCYGFGIRTLQASRRLANFRFRRGYITSARWLFGVSFLFFVSTVALISFGLTNEAPPAAIPASSATESFSPTPSLVLRASETKFPIIVTTTASGSKLTKVPAQTPTKKPTSTLTATPSNTPTKTLLATRTPSNTPTKIPIATQTLSSTPTKAPTATASATFIPTLPPTSTPTLASVAIQVYFTNQQRLVSGIPPYEQSVSRLIPSSGDPVAGALDQFFKGPSPTEQTEGLVAIQNGFVGYRRFERDGDILRIYLTGYCEPNGTSYNISSPLNKMLKQFPGIKYVKIYDAYKHTRDPNNEDDSSPVCLDAILSPTPTLTSTPTLTLTFTATPSSTPTKTPTETSSPTATWTPSSTPTKTPTETSSPTATWTPSKTATATWTPNTSTKTPTETSFPTATWTPSNTPTKTPTETSSPTSTWTPSNTPTKTPTETSSPTATWTPSNTPTKTPTATWTPSNTPTKTPTETSS